MNLPNRENAYITLDKLSDYLLLRSHPVGGSKARYLRSAGFNETNLQKLQEGLLNIAQSGEVQNQVSTPYGEKFIMSGQIWAPNGNLIHLKTVWIIDQNQNKPRFVTAYPE